jgi:hypothetical protein
LPQRSILGASEIREAEGSERMARADVPVVLTSTGTLQETDIGLSPAVTRVILRARSSNVQAVSCNLSLPAESDPTGTGGNALVLFPGESVTLDSVVAGVISL